MLSGSISLGRLAGAPLRIHWSAVLVGAIVGGALYPDFGLVSTIVVVIAFFASILVHEVGPRPRRPPLRHHARRRSTSGRSAAWPASTASPRRRAPRVGSPPPDRSPAWPSAPSASAACSPLYADRRAASSSLRVCRLDRPRERRPRRLQPAARRRRSTAAASCAAVRWASTATATGRCARPARPVGVIGWALAAARPRAHARAPDERRLRAADRRVRRHERPRRGLLRRHQRAARRASRSATLTWYGVAETGHDMDTDSMIWQRQRIGGAGAVAVRGDDGELDGLVLEDQLWAVPVEQRPWTMLTSLMAPFNRLARADPDDELATVLPRLNPLQPRRHRVARRSAARRRPAGRHQAAAADASSAPASDAQASWTAHSRLATGSLSLHGKLIHRSVRFHT